jgi:hypothetical protein
MCLYYVISTFQLFVWNTSSCYIPLSAIFLYDKIQRLIFCVFSVLLLYSSYLLLWFILLFEVNIHIMNKIGVSVHILNDIISSRLFVHIHQIFDIFWSISVCLLFCFSHHWISWIIATRCPFYWGCEGIKVKVSNFPGWVEPYLMQYHWRKNEFVTWRSEEM